MAEKMMRLEKARNGSFTCQYKINNEWRYLYSKYHPERSVKKVSINEDKDLIVMFGLGLGFQFLNMKEHNLNITRAFVETGLPMRVFDVLGSKGFLVTNDKNDINRLFKNGRDLVVYRDVKDLMEIIEYYLINDSAREEIIMRGFKTVKANHTYSIRIKMMMDYVYSALDDFVLE
jgi:spore maturation protein CgeB